MRTALVTGANRGIGFAIAKLLATRGDIRVLTAARNGEDAHATVAHIGHDTVAVTLDLSDPIHVEHQAQEIEAGYGPIDILVNNAAILTYGSLVEIHATDLTESIAVNAISPFSLIRALGPGMKARGWGRIVNVSSTVIQLKILGF
ncbi:SDR family NAD(P)-dependent oxidoreductase [Candidatus Entotheonella palauensis]|uniref:SDR family NAD(P)-dependent oxidoreductase n=1 Tax=Candidatus Entotheonella palauensis TaxID=93172 RepID=UPI000B7F9AD9|nr:SDR family oxidoreductase [Candidatus Entotheonella palauensis]